MYMRENPFKYTLAISDEEQVKALNKVMKDLPATCPRDFDNEFQVAEWMDEVFEDAVRIYLNGLGIEIE